MKLTPAYATSRLSTVKGASKIVVVDKGRVGEEGTHDELLARGGKYSDLVKRQLDSATGASVTPPLPKPSA